MCKTALYSSDIHKYIDVFFNTYIKGVLNND